MITAREELIDEAALRLALQRGQLVAAALDVLDNDQETAMADQPFIRYGQNHDNLVFTPHLGGIKSESLVKTEEILAQQLIAALPSFGDLAGTR
jgi:lactate dehydrogenase-like 2-hydroxyacid dehydrogenase